MSARRAFHAICTLLSALAFAAIMPTAAAAAPPFLWGAATSSYQVEGGLTGNDYDFFNRSPEIADWVHYNSSLAGPPINLAPAGEATRSWQPAYYRRDFDNARLLGLNSFRISLEWSRIEPTNNGWNDEAIAAYARMLDAMRARGLRPIVTLNHFTLPLWVLRPPTTKNCFVICYPDPNDAGFQSSLRGWENPKVVDEFEEFVRHVVPRLGARVDYWITLNEPVSSMVGVGYIGGVWSPGFVTEGERAKAVLHNLIEAHVRAYRIIHELDRVDADGDGVSATVGVAHAMLVSAPAGLDNEAALNMDYFMNDYFLNAIVNGEEDLNYLNSSPCCARRVTSSPQFVVHPEWRNTVDFIGLNYYRRAYAFHFIPLATSSARYLGARFENNLYGHFEQPHGLLNDLGWEIYPGGLYEILKRIKTNWNKPVLITENGIAERADRNRAAFIVAHLREVNRAMRDGVDVIGYLYWSLLDNWELHENYRREAQFGLFHVEREPGNLQRCLGSCHRALTEGALGYRQIVEESRRTDGLGRPTEAAIASAERRFGAYRPDGRQVQAPEQTSIRAYEGRASNGSRFELLVMRTDAGHAWLPLIYWYGPAVWHSATVQQSGSARILRERWYDDTARTWRTRDHRISASGGSLRGSYLVGKRKVSWIATLLPAVGLWRWTGSSPIGGPDNSRLFFVADLEGRYTGKFLAMPTPTRGQSWRELDRVTVTRNAGTTMELDAGHLFDLTLSLPTPDSAVTVERRSGSWAGAKSRLPIPVSLGFTGYTVPPGEIVWRGERSDGAFELSEGQAIFRSYRPGEPEQQLKEHDETAVLYRTFAFEPLERIFGVVVKARISFDAGGRHYETVGTATTCLIDAIPCTGTWKDIAGIEAQRIGDGMPSFP